jgi:uncharacterized protein with HEPN domain
VLRILSDRPGSSWRPKRATQRHLDILEHGNAVRESLAQTTRPKFLRDAVLQKATFYDLLCVSEAVVRLLELDPGIVRNHPGVPWRRIADMGSILRHEYGRVDARVVWDTITGGDLDDLLRVSAVEIKGHH